MLHQDYMRLRSPPSGPIAPVKSLAAALAGLPVPLPPICAPITPCPPVRPRARHQARPGHDPYHQLAILPPLSSRSSTLTNPRHLKDRVPSCGMRIGGATRIHAQMHAMQYIHAGQQVYVRVLKTAKAVAVSGLSDACRASGPHQMLDRAPPRAAYRNRTDDLRITKSLLPCSDSLTCTDDTPDRTQSTGCTGNMQPAVPRPVPRPSR